MRRSSYDPEGLAWPLVGRREELARTERALAAGAHAVVMAGAPGTGKTRLAHEALASARVRGAEVEWIVATRAAATVPLGAFIHLVDATSADHTHPLTQHQSVVSRLQERADRRQLIIGVDDAHLLDPASAVLLLHLRVSGCATVLMTVRTDEPCPDTVRALWKDGLAYRLQLPGLTDDEVGRLLVTVLGAAVEEGTRRKICAFTGGNPALVRGLVLDGLQAGSLAKAAGQWRWSGEVGSSGPLRDIVEERLAGISAAERQALELLAVGEPLGRNVYEGLVGADVVAGLARRDLVRMTRRGRRGDYHLPSPLYGRALVAALPSVVANLLRGQLVTALEATGARRSDDVLRRAAWRLDCDGTASPGLLTAGAQQAHATFDLALALRLADAAVTAGPDVEGLLTLARAYRCVNRPADAEAVLARIDERALAGDARGVYVAERVAALHDGLGRAADAEAVLDRAAGRSPALPQPVLDALRLPLLFARGRLEDVAAAAPALLRSGMGTPESVFVTGMALVQLGRLEEAAALADRAAAHASVRDNPRRGGDAAPVVTVWALLHQGRLDDAEALVASSHELAVRDRDRASLGVTTSLRGQLALLRGAVGPARGWLGEAIGHLEVTDERGLLPGSLAALAQACALAGEVHCAQTWQRAASTQAAARPPHGFTHSTLALAEIRIAMAGGELPHARRVALDRSRACGEDIMSEARLLHEALRVGCAPGGVAARLQTLARRSDSGLVAVYAAYADAAARRDGAALDSASASFAAMGARLFAAEAAAEACAAHRSSGRRGAELQSAARSSALAEGCVGLDRNCLPAPAPLPLSRREREVVALAGRGATNGQIASSLSVSVRTVESHLYHAFAKLGVARRSELPSVLV